jgi:hypothetical protein
MNGYGGNAVTSNSLVYIRKVGWQQVNNPPIYKLQVVGLYQNE